ncbi:MAG: hypothetical protein QOG80_2063 [Pseudonocardiales bacterium]|nr:hypothetical protein [Pseudonocardiales bacterium]
MAYDMHTGQFRTRQDALAPIGGRRSGRPPRPADWPEWAVAQLLRAAEIAEVVASCDGHPVLAAELYRRWFNPVVGPGAPLARPLAGVYRTAHAGNGTRMRRDEVWVIDRHDVVGRDGWWRTWNDSWVPTRSRTDGVRIMFSPEPDAMATFVHTVTGALRTIPAPWLLACPVDPARLARASAATVYLPAAEMLPAGLLEQLAPVLRDAAPPLCRPLAAGVALGQAPGNGMSFGEHRCHLVALALRTHAARRDPLGAVADVFRTHGVDPAHPYRSS